MSDEIPEIQIEAIPNADDPFIGRVLKGSYRLTKKVGEGGMGSVYLGVHEALGRKVAVKMLKINESNPEGEHYFMREVQAINMLRHPNIVSIVDFGKEDGELFLIMEFLPGQTLKRAIKKEYPLDPGRICEICVQVLSALEQSHSQGIVHCDLKPANIMIEELAGGRELVKVLDFGIAKVKGPAMEAGPYTQAGNIVGTFDYMSPEQIMRKDLDGRADVWSMGVILYEILTKQRLFHDHDAVSIIGRVMQMPIQPPIEVLGQGTIPPALSDITMKAMQRNVAKRYQSAAEMIKDLRRLQLHLEAGEFQASVPIAGMSDTPGDPNTGSQSGPQQGPASLLQTGFVRGARQPAGANLATQLGQLAGSTSVLAGRTGMIGGGSEQLSAAATALLEGTSIIDTTIGDKLGELVTGERRAVAVMAIMQGRIRGRGIDPETMASRARQERKIISDVVQQFGGELDNDVGGIITILFGATVARMDTNVQAVLCAHSLQERFRLLPHGCEHIGIALTFGEVYLAERKGGNAFGTPIDDAVDVARNVKNAEIFVEESLQRTTRSRVKYDAARTISSVPVAQVLGLASAEEAAEAEDDNALDQADIFVQRPDYTNMLEQRARAVLDGQGGGVVIVGELGNGKTSLYKHFLEKRKADAWQIFATSQEDLPANESLAPVREWIRQIAMTFDDPKVLVKKACGSMGLRQKVDTVVDLYLSAEKGAIRPEELPWGNDQTAFLHFTASLFHKLVRFAMKKGPVLLACDGYDIQDKVFVKLLESFVPQVARFKLLFLLTRRVSGPGEQLGLPADLELMYLEGFTDQESREFISQMLGSTPPYDVVKTLHDRTSGNPMFLKELVRALLKAEGSEVFASAQRILDANIPLNLQGLLGQRVDVLPQDHRTLLAVASVMGESFREDFFYQVAPAQLGPQFLLPELVGANFLAAHTDAFGRVLVSFNPRALREVVYERLPKNTRLELHNALIGFLEGGGAQVAAVDPIDVPMMLAFHHRSIESWEQAALYTAQVGEIFLNIYDYMNALAYFRESVELLDRGGLAPNDESRLRIVLLQLEALRESGRIEQAQAALGGLPELEDIPEHLHTQVLMESGLINMEAGSMESSLEALTTVVRNAQAEDDPKLEVRAMLALAQLFDKEGQLQRAASVLVKVAQTVERIGNLDLQDAEDRKLVWTALNQLGTLSIRQGNIPQAQQYLKAAYERAQQIEDHRGLLRILSNLGALFMAARDNARAVEFFKKGLHLAKSTGDLLNLSRILTNLGVASMEINDTETAKECFREARTLAEEIGWYEGLADLNIHIRRLRQMLHS